MLTLDPMQHTFQAPNSEHTIKVNCPAKPWFGLTWPKFRFAEPDISERWLPVAAFEDKDLVEYGFCLASQIRDASALTPEDQIELAQLLGRHGQKLSPNDQGRLSTLLECCPFTDNAPPLDIDPQAPDVTPEELEQTALRLSTAWINAGLGSINWFATGGRGLHGHFKVPDGLTSPYLMRAYGTMLRQAACGAGLPLLSAHRSREDRPRILVDDTLFDRDATGRGGLWRLVGAKHTKTGRRKHQISLRTDGPLEENAIREHVANLEKQLADRGRPVRKKPRALNDLNGLPVPHPQLLGRGALMRVSDCIAQCARAGANHDFRKALAGWLLREGVPTTVAVDTISAAGDPLDAAAVVRTTAERMMSGRNVFGFRKLMTLVGTMGANDFQACLSLDLEDAEVTPRDLSRFLSANERATLREAAVIAEKAGNTTRALTCRRAARCGLAHQKEACKACGDVGHSWAMVAERPTCPHCANRRARAIINWCIRRWPETVQCVTLQIPDHSMEAARSQRRKWAKKLPPKFRGKIRWIVAPGWLVAITADLSTGYHLNGGWVHAGWTSHVRPNKRHPNLIGHLALLKILRPVLAARAAHLRRYLRVNDATGLAADGWLEKVMEASGGKHAREHMPWPKPRDLRLDAINDRRIRDNEEPLGVNEPLPTMAERGAKRTNCCGSRIDYTLVDASDHGTIAIRDDRPWTFGEASVRAENGWRGERLEYDAKGRLLRTILPPGFDVTHLNE